MNIIHVGTVGGKSGRLRDGAGRSNGCEWS